MGDRPSIRSVNEGRLVAFEGETLRDDSQEPLDLLRFDREEKNFSSCFPSPRSIWGRSQVFTTQRPAP
jgi:hypothetical protein